MKKRYYIEHNTTDKMLPIGWSIVNQNLETIVTYKTRREAREHCKSLNKSIEGEPA